MINITKLAIQKLIIEKRKNKLSEDYNLRIERGQNKQFHYQNSIDTLNKAWKNGCPN